MFGDSEVDSIRVSGFEYCSAPYSIPRLYDYSSLMRHVKLEAIHYSSTVSGAPKCSPGTRVVILDDLCRWAAASEDHIRIQWIYGNERSGKSTLLRTLAKTLDKHRLLLASFFFGTADDPTGSDPFIPTIIHQIAHSNDSVRSHMEKAVQENPFILTQPLEYQADALIVQPITQAYEENGFSEQYPRIIIVDGLDESIGWGKQKEVLRALNKMLDVPIRLAILVASQTKAHILDTINSEFSTSSIRRFALEDPLQGFKSLSDHVATEALHKSGAVPDAILDNLYHWAAASEYDVRIQWIYGNESCGKSQLLRTLADMLDRHGLLLATFFFFGMADYQNNPDPFISTIAHQISQAIPKTRPHIERAIEADPFILSRSLEAQAETLIVDPIAQAHRDQGLIQEYPRVIVVDGLDKRKGEKNQQEVLRVLNQILEVPIPLTILIASRPEAHILHIFDTELNTLSTGRLALERPSEADQNFLKEGKICEICGRHLLRSPASPQVAGKASNSTPHIDGRVQPISKAGPGFSSEEKFVVEPCIPDPAHPNRSHPRIIITIPDGPTQDDLDERESVTDFPSSIEDLSGPSGARGLLRKIQGYMPLMMKASQIDPETERNRHIKQKKFVDWLNSKGNLRAERTNVDQITPDDVVIAVMGPTGSGKSSFITLASELNMGIGCSLKSHTGKVSVVRFSSPALTDSDIVLVDTPGFDDTEKTDVEILIMISGWLSDASKERIPLAGLLYFHRISDNRMAGTPLKNLKMFQELCGKGMLKNVIFVTTMWDEVDTETGSAREAQLREKYWRGLISQGSRIRRYLRDARSAFLILEPLVEAANTRNAEVLKAELAEIEKNRQTLAAKASSLRQLPRPRRRDAVPGLEGKAAFDADRGVEEEGTQGTNAPRGRGRGARPKAIPMAQPQMRIPKEMQDYELELQATSAGQALYAQLGSLITRREEFLKRMKEQMSQLGQDGGGADRQAVLSKEFDDLKNNLEATLKEMEELKLPLGDPLRRIIKKTISMKH